MSREGDFILGKSIIACDAPEEQNQNRRQLSCGASIHMKRVVVVGAGVGGLTTAATLAKAGMDVTMLEAHIYPGGCAGTFFYQGYRFDAGATLAGGFYPSGPMDLVAQATGIEQWDTRPSNPTMVVHMPDKSSIPRWSDDRRWSTRRAFFGAEGERFFEWQETTAEALWDLALRGIPWPPQSPGELVDLMRKGFDWLASDPPAHLRSGLLADAFRPVQAHLKDASAALKLFLDGQLLISAQTTNEHANALYAASALDLPRRGAVHLSGGMGSISTKLAQAVEQHGGKVLMRKRVKRVRGQKTSGYEIELERGEPVKADIVIFNLPPWNIRRLLDPTIPNVLRRLSPHPEKGWGAFMLYLGVDTAAIPEGFVSHHQILQGRPLAEGNSIFLSINPEWDTTRAPAGKRAITISTHTALEPWWRAKESGEAIYQRKREQLQEKLMRAVESLLPAVRNHVELNLDGTPLTFAYFTGRDRGWVGGFPQTNLFQGFAPRLAQKIWMVGDSIFPGQSTAAVALGGLRVARSVLAHAGGDAKSG